MLRRSLLAMAGATLAACAARATPLGHGDVLSFVAHRNGQRIGTHVVTFHDEAGSRMVTTQIDFAVRMLGISVYRYRHLAQEVWRGEEFQAIASETDDNGDKYALKAQREGSNLIILRREPETSFKTSSGDESLEQKRWIRDVHPVPLLPSTHWNIAQTRQQALLNSQTGKVMNVRVSELGRETDRTASSAPAATHFSYGGDFTMEQWFDDNARWVKALFKAPSDGSTIEYTLQG